MNTIASQITSLAIVYSTLHSGANQRKHQSSASLAFVRGIHRWSVNSLLKWSATRKMFPFEDVIIWNREKVFGHMQIIRWAMLEDPFSLHRLKSREDAPSKWEDGELFLKHWIENGLGGCYNPKRILNSNLAKYRLSKTSILVVKPFWNFAQNTVVIPSWYVQDFKTSWRLSNEVWAKRDVWI